MKLKVCIHFKDFNVIIKDLLRSVTKMAVGSFIHYSVIGLKIKIYSSQS